MDPNDIKFHEDDDRDHFSDFESDEEDSRGLDLGSYRDDGDFVDGFEKIEEQTELYKSMIHLPDEDEDTDFFVSDAEMSKDDDEMSDDYDDEWTKIKTRKNKKPGAHMFEQEEDSNDRRGSFSQDDDGDDFNSHEDVEFIIEDDEDFEGSMGEDDVHSEDEDAIMPVVAAKKPRKKASKKKAGKKKATKKKVAKKKAKKKSRK